MIKKILLAIVIFAVALSAFLFWNRYRAEKRDHDLAYENMELELSPLYEQEIELKQERSSLDKEYEKEKIGEGTLQIIATEPVSLVYDKIFRVMQEYKDMKAMVGVSYNCVPGSKEMISVKEAQKLKAEGWAFCYSFVRDEMRDYGNDEAAMHSWITAVKEKAEEAQITLQPAVYFKDGDYRNKYSAWLKKEGIKVIVHHGEIDGNELITYESEDEMWYIAACPWNSDGVSALLDEVADDGTNIVYSIGSSSSTEKYDESVFRSMLSKVDTGIKEGKLAVTDFREMIALQSEDVANEYVKEYKKRMQEIDEELESLERQMDDVVKKYDIY